MYVQPINNSNSGDDAELITVTGFCSYRFVQTEGNNETACSSR